MSNYDMIQENQVEMVELSDEAMEAVAGGGSNNFLSYNYIVNSDVFVVVQFDSYADIFNYQWGLRSQ